MESVVDKIVAEITTFKDTAASDGGCSDILAIECVYWGDPGILPIVSYPAITVQPVRDQPQSETTGYEVRDLEVQITLLVDARVYFDAETSEADGDRKLTQVMASLRAWLRRTSNRQLDGMPGVRDVRVSATTYLVQVRGSVIAKSAQTSLLVNKQYSRQA